MSAFWLVVIGGVFTLIGGMLGGYFGSRMLVRDEEKRERKELIGAIQMSRAELARNITTIIAKQGATDVPPTARLELCDDTFRAVAPILARGLPMPLFGWISEINNQAARLRDVPAIQGRPKAEMDALEYWKERAAVANRLLIRYLKERLDFETPRVSAEESETPEQIEQSLTRMLFPTGGAV